MLDDAKLDELLAFAEKANHPHNIWHEDGYQALEHLIREEREMINASDPQTIRALVEEIKRWRELVCSPLNEFENCDGCQKPSARENLRRSACHVQFKTLCEDCRRG